MTDQNRKTLRSFYCRDYLWELFEQMTQELGCSMDYLINESMRMYTQNREYPAGSPERHDSAMQFPQGAQPPVLNRTQTHSQGGERMHVAGHGGQATPGMDHRTFERMPAVNRNAPPPPGPGGYGTNPPPPPRPGHGPGGWQPVPHAPGSGYPVEGPPGRSSSVRAPVYLIFNNNRYIIDQDKFVIGRGSQQTDLTIRDGNISRKHCAIIHRNGQFYIKDLGSTNGIEYRGNRIESKKIDEGDTFFLCDYELHFTYRA